MENLTVTDTQLFETFREAFGTEKAERAVNAIKNITHSEMENQTQILATSKQLSALETATCKQLSALETATSKQLSALETATCKQLSALEMRLNDRIHKSQFQVVFWIVSIGVLQFIASYLLGG